MLEAGDMNVVIVYESMFGNTHEIAEAIRDGVREAAPDAELACLPVAEANPELTQVADLLIVGGPTHMRGMTSSMTRKMGISAEEKKDEAEQHELEPGAEGPGVRDWFESLPKATRKSRAAALDTRAEQRFAGGAAHGIARRLRRHGYDVVADEGFIIEDAGGPLRDGERQRAKAWGAALVRQRAG
jgi:Flavodoxin